MFRQNRTSKQASLELFDLGALLNRPRHENEATIRRLCQVAYLGDETVLGRALGRYKIYLDTSDEGLSPHLMLDGYWEMWVTEAICARLGSGMIAADIGANLGYYSLLMADLVGSLGKVHSFEPNPRMARHLERSLSINGFGERAKVHPVALGATDGEGVLFVVPPGEPKNAHLLRFAGSMQPGSTLMQTVRLDGDPDWANIQFAKIDVEGAEELVWAGSKGLLDNGTLRTVVLEFTSGRYRDPGAFIDQLLEPGFNLSWIDPVQGITALKRDDLLGMDSCTDVMLLLER